MATATGYGSRDTVRVAGGASVAIRPITPDDAADLDDLYAGCSDQSRYQRLHSCRRRLRNGEAEYLAGADGRTRIALVATVDGRLVADARAEPLGGGDVEAALLVHDDLHRGGLGRALLARLIDRAAAAGYRRMLLHVLPENRAMVGLAGRFGATPVGTDGWAVTFAIPLPPTGRFGG
jgi:GNAT superfamily N-acetyltransferase